MNTATIIPVGPGREQNMSLTLESLSVQTTKPSMIVCVLDGPDASVHVPDGYPIPVETVRIPKHTPGQEQPRNVGVLHAQEKVPDLTHVWFLDSDIICLSITLEKFVQAMMSEGEPRILVGPYDWLPPGAQEPVPDLKNDPRWVTFDESYPWEIRRGELAAGLACFSGNLVWPVDLFAHVGGFWDELHHGRCEDGELGLRAVAMGVGVSFVKEARGWHVWHQVDINAVHQKNSRDVPMLNERHKWKERPDSGGEELLVVEEDGRRFNWRCGECGEEMNSALIWAHKATHR